MPNVNSAVRCRVVTAACPQIQHDPNRTSKPVNTYEMLAPIIGVDAMSEGAQPHIDGDARAAAIADVADIPLDGLLRSDDSVLSNSVRRVLLQIETEGESYAAHSSSM
jgi:hypothetical protein